MWVWLANRTWPGHVIALLPNKKSSPRKRPRQQTERRNRKTLLKKFLKRRAALPFILATVPLALAVTSSASRTSQPAHVYLRLQPGSGVCNHSTARHPAGMMAEVEKESTGQDDKAVSTFRGQVRAFRLSAPPASGFN